MKAVTALDFASGVLEVVNGLPGGGVPAQLLDQVLVLSCIGARVQHFFDLPFFVAFNLYRGWRRHDLSVDRVVASWLQERDVEDRVDPHGRRQGQALDMGADNLADRVGTKAFVVMFLGRLGGLDVPRREPDFGAYLEAWSGGARDISVLLVFVLGKENLRPEVVVGLFHMAYEVVEGYLGSRLGCRRQGEVHAWMVTLIREEWGKSCSFRPMVVGRKLCYS